MHPYFAIVVAPLSLFFYFLPQISLEAAIDSTPVPSGIQLMQLICPHSPSGIQWYIQKCFNQNWSKIENDFKVIKIHMANFILSLCSARQGDQNSYFVCLNWTSDARVIKFEKI
jgi:hypothetical protein